jgi:hypothetical protein
LTKRKRTILRKRNSDNEIGQSLIEFINDRIFSLISDEFDKVVTLSELHYEPVWTRKLGESYIKNIRISQSEDIFQFRSLDICIVEAYSLEMDDIVGFLRDNGSKKVRFKRS